MQKLWLNINGADRMVVCDPEKDSLADLLRRLGLTGTKVGCGTGVCGACSVILNDKVIRSCTRKMKSVPEFSKIITIEGIGTANNLHPLQQAFIFTGAVQCGFCTPGFIISAYQLLKENISPTREEVRVWFKKHSNYCRCTGYKQITDAVMLAAQVMRGELTMDDITFKSADGKFYNTSMERPDSLAKVCGTADYGEDTALKMPPGMLHVALVQPKVTFHAKILNVDISEAEKMPGVVKVILPDDIRSIGGNNMFNLPFAHPRYKIDRMTRPLLSEDKIVRWGDTIALVVADTKEHAREAAKHVKMEYEELPAYMELIESVAPDAVEIHEGFPNIYLTTPVIKGKDADEVISSSAYEVSGSWRSPRQPHLSIEGDIIIAYKDEDDNLVLQCKSQALFPNLMMIGKGIGVPTEKLRMIQHGAIGASFGWSVDNASYAYAGAACVITGQPCCLSMTWEEHQNNAGKRTPSYSNARLGADENGKITGLEYEIAADHGAYVEWSDLIIFKYVHFGVPYNIPNIRGLAKMVSTNAPQGVAWRGYGMPQCTTSTEGLMNLLTQKTGIDGWEIRRRNVMSEKDHSPNNSVFKGFKLPQLMDMAKDYYYEKKAKAKELDTPEVRRGVGISCMFFPPLAGARDKAEARIELREDGRFYVFNTYQAMGQGSNVVSTAAAIEALKPLNLTPKDIQLELNDTGKCPNSGISAGSRSTYMNTGAIHAAGQLMLDAMRKEDGTYRTYEEMVAEGIPTKHTGFFTVSDPSKQYVDMDWNTGLMAPDGEDGWEPDPMCGVTVSEVAVDTATGKTQVLSVKSWADCGVIVSYLGATGQAFGGMAQSLGFALSEDYREPKKNNNIVKAGMPSILDVPDDLSVEWIEDHHNEKNPFGSNGLSELFTSGVQASYITGIFDATGVVIYELPARPEKVKAGLDTLAKGEDIKPTHYNLGGDFYDVLEDVQEEVIPADWLSRFVIKG